MSSRKLRSRIVRSSSRRCSRSRRTKSHCAARAETLLPTLDVYGYYGAQGIGGAFNQASCQLAIAFGQPCTPFATSGYSDALSNLVNSSSPDKGIGFNFQIPIRNRTAQADQARSLIEYRQAEMHLEQLYTQIRMQVVNAAIRLGERPCAGAGCPSPPETMPRQSLDAEQKKLHLGASTTANVLLQERNLANRRERLHHGQPTYAKDRARLYQVLADNLAALRHQPERCCDRQGDPARPVIPGVAACLATRRLLPRRRPAQQLVFPSQTREARRDAGLLSSHCSDPLSPWSAVSHRSATLSSRSKNSGKLIAADSAP